MNIPNKLTLLRVLLVPVFCVFVSLSAYPMQLFAFAIFVLASLTDLLDGYLARKHNQITDLGKLMDPIADKLLVMAALVCLTAQGRVHFVLVLILLGREFVISGVRLMAASRGKLIAADNIGKLKTVFQLVGILLLLLGDNQDGLRQFLQISGQWVLLLSALLSIWSCIDYIAKNWEVLAQ